MKLLRVGAFFSILLMVAVMFLSTGALPRLYDPYSPASLHVTDRYIEDAVEETGSANLVTAVLADYRGYDTLGETTVIFTAGLATVLLLKTTKSATKQGSKREAAVKEDKS